jgi:ABC-type glycerol-3-phosphate transport system substrate-binding protein/DNA-binding transcriptional regulator YhcF (GntR family)
VSIDPERPIPIYLQLKALLTDEIVMGRYGRGDRLPTEHELCEQYGISRTPVTRALAELAHEGVLRRHRGVGTFVNPQWLRRTAAETSELQVIVQEGPWGDLVREVAPEHPQVSVVTIPRPDLHEVLEHAVAEGRAPDLAIFDSVWVPEFAAAGFLCPLEDLDDKWVRLEHETDFLEPMVEANRFDGRTYGAAIYATVSGLWYRHAELEGLGLAPPATWTDLRSAARVVAASDGIRHPIVMTGGLKGGETTAFELIGCLASNGAHVFGADGVTVNSRETVQTLRFLRGLVEDELMPPEVVDYEWNEPIRLLADRRAAMSLGGSYEAPTLAAALGVQLDALSEHVGFIPFPAGPKGVPASVAGGMSCCVFRQTRNPRMAMRLLESVVDPHALARPARAMGRIPARRSAIALTAPRIPFVAQAAKMFNTAVNQPATPSYPRVSIQLQGMLEAVLTGRLGATAAARQAGELITAITG